MTLLLTDEAYCSVGCWSQIKVHIDFVNLFHAEHFCHIEGEHGLVHAKPLQQQNLVRSIYACSLHLHRCNLRTFPFISAWRQFLKLCFFSSHSGSSSSSVNLSRWSSWTLQTLSSSLLLPKTFLSPSAIGTLCKAANGHVLKTLWDDLLYFIIIILREAMCQKHFPLNFRSLC